jgi:hypothetical protein
MKRAVSISIGSSKRNKAVEIELLGEKVHIERIGTDGDMDKAAAMYRDLDGKVDAFGVGGADLGVMVDRHWYPLYSVHKLVKDIKITPTVDGTGLKNTLEKKSASILRKVLGDSATTGKKALIMTGVDRWGMLESFVENGYTCVFGDMMFSLGMPFALHKVQSVKTMAALLMPIAGRVPFHWVYPTGKEQEKRTPKHTEWFDWADVIAGDCHYITRYMPDQLPGKIVVTNTTTQEDMKLFKDAGVKSVVTTTPVLDGRSFGTNMMEAAIMAASGRKAPIDYSHPGNYFEELGKLVEQIGFEPQFQEIN